MVFLSLFSCLVFAGQHAGIKVCRSHALHTRLQTMGPGSSRWVVPPPHPRFHIIIIIILSEMLREAFKCPCLFLSGVHWLGATFWMVSQQTDIIRSTTRWRIFNLVLGAIHIFFFLNVKYGQSRCRMAGFYLVCVSVLGRLITPNVVHIFGGRNHKNTLPFVHRTIIMICVEENDVINEPAKSQTVSLIDFVCEEPRKSSSSELLLVLLQVMFIENVFLLLASSWLFSMVSWDTVGIPAAVLCSFLIGESGFSGKLWG